uniref:Protein kinase domain-containing protein n=1 Tax=Bursaphelenchus xylophilus TaxID=6326 RepID=A0A1I7SWS2_BURXY
MENKGDAPTPEKSGDFRVTSTEISTSKVCQPLPRRLPPHSSTYGPIVAELSPLFVVDVRAQRAANIRAPSNPIDKLNSASFLPRFEIPMDTNFKTTEMDLKRRSRVERFIIGDSDTESESGHEPRRRRLSSSDLSDEDDHSVVGGAPTTLDFELDEDLQEVQTKPVAAFFIEDDDEEDESRPALNEQHQLVPLRPLGIGQNPVLKAQKHRQRRNRFSDFYRLANDHLGSGAYASVRTGICIETGKEYAVKVVNKHEPGHTRSRILREVEIFKMCANHPNIVQMVEWFEDEDTFYMIFEKMRGGPLLNHIQRKVCFTEQEASMVTRDIANALKHLHERGIAHRDVKPENILCTDLDRVSPVKLCDLDLASKPSINKIRKQSRTLHNVQSEPDLASPVGSAEFMAPEVVDAFVGDALKYDKRCDMWSLGVIIYIMLCGYTPFYGECERENCGWDQGQPCTDCQESLFHRIQRGDFDFPEEDWANISVEAKDLISHLLVKNVRLRYTATDVLKHKWVCGGAPETPLQTANNLFRNDSARDVHQMNEHFNVMNRLTAVRLSARLEETVPDLGSSPETELVLSENVDESEEEKGIENAENTENVPIEVPPPIAKSPDVFEQSDLPPPEANKPFQQVQPQPDYNPTFPVYAPPPPMFTNNYVNNYGPPPVINMNGMLLYAPTQVMATQDGPTYFNQFYPPCAPMFNQIDPAMVPQWPQNPQRAANQFSNAHWSTKPENIDTANRGRQLRAERLRQQRSLTPGYQQHVQTARNQQSRQSKNKKLFPTNIRPGGSHAALETCQNAMVRQESSHDLHHRQTNRETQVNV